MLWVGCVRQPTVLDQYDYEYCMHGKVFKYDYHKGLEVYVDSPTPASQDECVACACRGMPCLALLCGVG